MTRLPRAGRDAAALLLLGVVALLVFLPFWARGLTSFWGDLTYIHRPWRVFDAQCLNGGRLPLWDPYVYFGMPAAASMQDSLFYPGNLPYFFFGFPAATALFQLVHYWLAAALAFLWLRSLGLRRSAALLGAAVYAFCGLAVSNMHFLNHLAVLALLPAALLAPRRPRLAALALALAFFAGYPPFWLGVCLLTALALVFSRPGALAKLPGVLAAAAALCACLLAPAVELVFHSRRSAGVGLAEALRFGFAWSDLPGWVSPVLLHRALDYGVDWWRTSYLGFVACAMVVLGLFALEKRRSLALAGWLGFIVLLTLGASFAPSRWLWAHLPPLRFVRYPGNVSYLAMPALALLAAAGLSRVPSRGARLALAGACALELLLCAWAGFKPAPWDLWNVRGPAVAALQARLDSHRFLLSPRAEEAETGRGVRDWVWRLYGLAPAPYRLSAAAGFGEPLVPQADYALMDRLFSAPSAQAAAAFFPWADIEYLLTPAPVGAPDLRHETDALWSFERFTGAPAPARAYWLSVDDGAALPRDARPPEHVRARPLDVSLAREDRVDVEGDTRAGWAYISQPRFPGWEAYLETPLGAGRAAARPALGPFEEFAVPAGRWRLTLLYRPETWRAGLLVSLLAWLWLLFSSLARLRREAA